MPNPSTTPASSPERVSGLALPTGTVTFLFTVIEGSSKLAQEHPVERESTASAIMRL